MHSIRLYAPQEILGRLLFFGKWISYVTSLFYLNQISRFLKRSLMFTTALNGQYSHQKRSGFLFVFNCKMSFLWSICRQGTLAVVTAGGNVVSLWRFNSDRNKYSRCQSLGKCFERPRTERAFACLTRATIEWKQEWTFLRNRKIINEQKKTSIFTCT